MNYKTFFEKTVACTLICALSFSDSIAYSRIFSPSCNPDPDTFHIRTPSAAYRMASYLRGLGKEARLLGETDLFDKRFPLDLRSELRNFETGQADVNPNLSSVLSELSEPTSRRAELRADSGKASADEPWPVSGFDFEKFEALVKPLLDEKKDIDYHVHLSGERAQYLFGSSFGHWFAAPIHNIGFKQEVMTREREFSLEGVEAVS